LAAGIIGQPRTSRSGRHFASEFAAANFERRASIGVSSQLRTLLGPEVPQQASATPLTKYDLFAPLHLASANWLGASCATLTTLRCRAGKLMRSFRCSRPQFCAACPEADPAWSHQVSPRRANRSASFGALAEWRQDRKGADLFRVRGAIRAHPRCAASSTLLIGPDPCGKEQW
jgi:hypothetical protein